MNEGATWTPANRPLVLSGSVVRRVLDKALWDLLDKWAEEERVASRRRKKVIGKQADQLWEILSAREGGEA